MDSGVKGLLLSFGYAGAILVAAEAARACCAVPTALTRKAVHISAGMWVFAIPALFSDKAVGLVPFASFIFINWALYRLRMLPSVDAPDASPGTVFFALSITALFAVLWRPDAPGLDLGAVAQTAVMAMTWGDALAALVGQRCGRMRYRALAVANERTLEGSLAMLLVSWAAMLGALACLPVQGSMLPLAVTAPATLWAAAAATLVEAASPFGLDNLLVPPVAAAVLLSALPVRLPGLLLPLAPGGDADVPLAAAT